MTLYYAIFNIDDDGINVSFPDLDGAFTAGEDMSEALYMARDLLGGWLINAEDDGETIPAPSDIQDIKIPNEDLLIPIEVNLDIMREKFDNQLVKKTLTIPKYLNTLAIKEGINFSQLLSDTLKQEMNV